MAEKIKQVVILSAGLGTRLRPLTDNIPKVMLPIAGKPLLEWHIEQFKKHGVKEFFINLFHLPEVIKNHFGDGSRWGVKITYVLEEPEIRGTAGGVKNFENFLDEAFFVLYGDMFSLLDYRKMTESFFQKPAVIGMAVIGRNDHPLDSDLVEVGDDLQFLKIHQKPHKELPKNWRTLDAVYIFKKKVLAFIPPTGTYYEIDHQLLPDILAEGEKFYSARPNTASFRTRMKDEIRKASAEPTPFGAKPPDAPPLGAGRLYGYETTDFLKDIGTMERYKEVENYLSKTGKAHA